MPRHLVAAACLCAGLLCSRAAPMSSQVPLVQDAALPHLEQRGQATQLIVDGQPFLVLGGELHNSSSSSVEYMRDVYPRLAAMHLNTVVVPVAWETIEPTEGRFDFRNVDGLLEGARQHHLKLVVLWFGTWKNTFSSYVPSWVKREEARFPRVLTSAGRATERISTFSTAARTADAHAFASLMRHLREVDAKDYTVLMVQVENEVGVLPEDRDYAPVANAAFAASVPESLMQYLQAHRATLQPELRTAWENAGAHTTGTWQQVFGTGSLTGDLFMAWQFATYIQPVTAAGKAEYALPMYTNAALVRPNYEPGQYNSGGPLPHSIDVWRAGAPALDFLSPDIYFNEFAAWSRSYAQPGNPLFIPEAQGGAAGAANVLYAFGQLRAIGFSPFGIDDIGNAPLDLVGITTPAEIPDNAATAAAYARLQHLLPILTTAQQNGAATAALIEGEAQRGARVPVGSFIAELTRAGGAPGARLGAMFLQTGPEEFLVVGSGDVQVTFTSRTPGPSTVGIDSIDEETFVDGAWVPRRRLNGDESSQGQSLRLRASDSADGRIYRVRLYRYGKRGE